MSTHNPWPWLGEPEKLEEFYSPEPVIGIKGFHGTQYEVGQTYTAVCLAGHYLRDWVQDHQLQPHQVPGEDCTCGFYAWKPDAFDDSQCCGDYHAMQVELSGIVIEHERGYRGEVMTPVKRIDMPHTDVHLHGGPLHMQVMFTQQDEIRLPVGVQAVWQPGYDIPLLVMPVVVYARQPQSECRLPGACMVFQGHGRSE